MYILQGHKDANGLRLKPFPHFDDRSLVFGKDRANGKGAMSATDILEELDQGEASNDIGVDDLAKPMPLILIQLHQLQVEWNAHHNLVEKE